MRISNSISVEKQFQRQSIRFYARGHVHLSSSLTSAITCLQSIQSAAELCQLRKPQGPRQSRQRTPQEGNLLDATVWHCQWSVQRGYHVLAPTRPQGRRKYASGSPEADLAKTGRRFDTSRSLASGAVHIPSRLLLVHLPVGNPTNHYTYRLNMLSAPLMKYAGR